MFIFNTKLVCWFKTGFYMITASVLKGLKVLFKTYRKSAGSSKNDTIDFQISPLFERSTCFYVTISGNFEVVNFETDLLGNKNLFQKTRVLFFENPSFPYKTAILEADVKTNRMVNMKWTYHKEQSFASNYYILSKILFPFKKFL